MWPVEPESSVGAGIGIGDVYSPVAFMYYAVVVAAEQQSFDEVGCTTLGPGSMWWGVGVAGGSVAVRKAATEASRV
jgi:hypothetical protein